MVLILEVAPRAGAWMGIKGTVLLNDDKKNEPSHIYTESCLNGCAVLQIMRNYSKAEVEVIC